MEVKYWILTVVCFVSWEVIKWFMTKGASKVETLLSELVTEVKELNERMAKYDEKFTAIGEDKHVVNNRLDDHGKRLRELEISQHKCRNYEQIGGN